MKQSSNKIGIIGNIMLISCTPWYDTMRRVIHLCSIFFTNPLWEKISKLKLRNILQHIWQLLSQNVKVIGNNERQKKICHRLEETKQTWQLNAVWYSGLALQMKKDIVRKTYETQICSLANSIVSMLTS